MRNQLPTNLILIAALQFIPPLVLPPDVLAGVSPTLWGLVVFLFAVLGINLLRRRGWARLASIFVQGFSIIVRLLVLVGHARLGTDPSAPLNTWLLSTSAVSMLLSGLILYAIDEPAIQMAMQ